MYYTALSILHDTFCNVIHCTFCNGRLGSILEDIALYGVATVSRLLQIIGLCCKRALLKRWYSAKETYDFKEPTNRSHPIAEYYVEHFVVYYIVDCDLHGTFCDGIHNGRLRSILKKISIAVFHNKFCNVLPFHNVHWVKILWSQCDSDCML